MMKTDALNGQVALITGGATGIGRGIAAAFLAQGAQLVLCSRNEEQLKRTTEELGPPAAYRCSEDRDHAFGVMFDALDSIRENEVYICTGSSPNYACWGELMSTAAIHRSAAGAVVEGYSRW